MLFTANIGNTGIAFGVFDGDSLLFSASIANRPNATKSEYAVTLSQVLRLHGTEPEQLDDAVLSSVVPMMTPVLKQALALLTGREPLVVSAGVKTGLNLKVNAGGLGSDFVCAAVCAAAEYPLPCIIISFGTATTFAAMDENGVFLGTSIACGVQSALNALDLYAAQLPLVGADKPRHLIAGTTVSALHSGSIFGTAAMTDGMCRRFEQELGAPMTKIATGRFAEQIIPYCEEDYILDTSLLLKGLKRIYGKNKKR